MPGTAQGAIEAAIRNWLERERIRARWRQRSRHYRLRRNPHLVLRAKARQ